MKLEEVKDILEAYGIDRILEDNRMTLADVIDIMTDLGYLHLDMYVFEDTDDYLSEGED